MKKSFNGLSYNFWLLFCTIISPSDVPACESRRGGTEWEVQTSPGKELTVLVSNSSGLWQGFGEGYVSHCVSFDI